MRYQGDFPLSHKPLLEITIHIQASFTRGVANRIPRNLEPFLTLGTTLPILLQKKKKKEREEKEGDKKSKVKIVQ